MNVTTGTHPVRHFVCDNFVDPQRDWTVPPPESDAWECVYSNDAERGKRTLRAVTGWAADVLRRMRDLEVLRACAQLFDVIAHPDTLSWGGGLQVTQPGGYLAPHLDGVVHPKRPHLCRVVQLVCFCHYQWQQHYGGEFAFYSPGGDVVAKIQPLPGRLIAFDSRSDLAYHGVLPVATESPVERISIAMSLLSEARPTDTRVRALFMPVR